MYTTLTMKLTEHETDLLDWLVAKLNKPSRSDTLRCALIDLAQKAGASRGIVLDAVEERLNRPTRRAPKKKARR